VRIAFVSDAVYPWHFGGLEVLEHAEAKELAKSHDVHFFSMQWPGMERTFKQEGITYHAAHKVTQERFYRHGRRSIREALVFSFGMLRIFRHRFDVVVSNEFPVLQLPILKFYCALTGAKLIVDMHEVWDKKYWTQYLGNVPGIIANAYASFALKVADAYIANSSTTKDRLVSNGVEKRRIRIFSPVIDDKFMSGISADKKSMSVIFWGRLIKEKRIDKWLHVVHDMAGKVHGLRATIIGDGPERKNIERLIKGLKLDDVVELKHSYSSERRAKLFKTVKDAGLLLQMSEREGLSMIVLESIALGTPALVPSYSPIPKEVMDMCMVADERDIAAVAARMLNGKDKGAFIRHRENLKEFYVSNINSFYSALFNSLK
jgi:glycosyltransferase involved in cell wall biosynthesis